MQAAYSLNSNELNINFLNSVKEMFQNKNIEIIITDKVESEFEQYSNTLHERLNDYKNNPDSFLPIDDNFWKDTEARLKAKHKKAV